jgi:hypothetical protein
MMFWKANHTAAVVVYSTLALSACAVSSCSTDGATSSRDAGLSQNASGNHPEKSNDANDTDDDDVAHDDMSHTDDDDRSDDESINDDSDDEDDDSDDHRDDDDDRYDDDTPAPMRDAGFAADAAAPPPHDAGYGDAGSPLPDIELLLTIENGLLQVDGTCGDIGSGIIDTSEATCVIPQLAPVPPVTGKACFEGLDPTGGQLMLLSCGFQGTCAHEGGTDAYDANNGCCHELPLQLERPGVWCGRPRYWDQLAVIHQPNLLDQDGDQVSDLADNCPFVSNVSQQDTDNDGVGDACEELIVTLGDPMLQVDPTCEQLGHGVIDADEAVCLKINPDDPRLAGVTPGYLKVCVPNPSQNPDPLSASHLVSCAAREECSYRIRKNPRDPVTGKCCHAITAYGGEVLCAEVVYFEDVIVAASENFVDEDDDFRVDLSDNCVGVFNPLQTDSNNDGIGDACDENAPLQSNL